MISIFINEPVKLENKFPQKMFHLPVYKDYYTT